MTQVHTGIWVKYTVLLGVNLTFQIEIFLPHQRESIVLQTENSAVLVADSPGLGKTGMVYIGEIYAYVLYSYSYWMHYPNDLY